ncbi:MAG: hypothetical protein KDA60_15900, partial [Planctomycetales bacterium]|nr:hypothetical protein [Planctomycetales bacterium]
MTNSHVRLWNSDDTEVPPTNRAVGRLTYAGHPPPQQASRVRISRILDADTLRHELDLRRVIHCHGSTARVSSDGHVSALRVDFTVFRRQVPIQLRNVDGAATLDPNDGDGGRCG